MFFMFFPITGFEIITFNVKGLGSFEKRRKVFNYLKKHTTANAIAFLQETHSTEAMKQSGKLSGVVKWGTHMEKVTAEAF